MDHSSRRFAVQTKQVGRTREKKKTIDQHLVCSSFNEPSTHPHLPRPHLTSPRRQKKIQKKDPHQHQPDSSSSLLPSLPLPILHTHWYYHPHRPSTTPATPADRATSRRAPSPPLCRVRWRVRRAGHFFLFMFVQAREGVEGCVSVCGYKCGRGRDEAEEEEQVKEENE